MRELARAGPTSSTTTGRGPTPCVAARCCSSCSSTPRPAPSRPRRRRRCPRAWTAAKNWDYRYAWVRDSPTRSRRCSASGCARRRTPRSAGCCAPSASTDREPHVFYAPGRATPPEPVGARRARLAWDRRRWSSGNRASDQLQLGVFGDVFGIVRALRRQRQRPRRRHRAALAGARRPRLRPLAQQGLRHVGAARASGTTSTSKLGCWQALTKAVHLAELGQIPGDPSRWRTEAERDPRLGRRARLVRAAAELRLVPRHRPAGRLDPAARHQRVRPRRADERDDRRPARRLGAGPHLYRFSGARRTGGQLRRVLVLDGVGAAPRRPRGRGARR